MIKRSILFAVSFLAVAFGQPAFSSVLSVFVSLFGYCLFWISLLDVPSAKKRFWVGMCWFSAVTGVQLFWLLSHPFAYAYALHLFLCIFIGMQFGILSVFITKERVGRLRGMLGIAGLYTLMEWGRLFLFSGFSFNPIGLSMTGTLWGLQGASLFGAYGLTFFVLTVNLLALSFFLKKKILNGLSYSTVALAPYLFGYWNVQEHAPNANPVLNTLLVQTAFPIEENLSFASFSDALRYVEAEWDQVLGVLFQFYNQKTDLIVLPEYVVPYGAHLAIFPFKDVKQMFKRHFGEITMPDLQEPLAVNIDGEWRVGNAYICQAVANLFSADVIAGLSDSQWIDENTERHYNSAFYFWPDGQSAFRYEKRVLLPMGEYIPFEFCKQIAAGYGVGGSFECGKEAKVFPGSKAPFGLCICYEETYGNMMRENRLKGAELLVNVTSDVWYPHSKLPKQHFDHARLRTVETGIPLVRACNTGITAAVDSVGQVIGCTLEEDEWVRQGLFVKVPLSHYKTLYTFLGDYFVIGGSFLLSLFLFRKP